MSAARNVVGIGLGLPCVGVRVVIHEHTRSAQQWQTLSRREGESEDALADRAWAVACTLAAAGACPAWFRLELVTHVNQLEHCDAWHNARFALHRKLHTSKTKHELMDAARRLMNLHGETLPTSPSRMRQ